MAGLVRRIIQKKFKCYRTNSDTSDSRWRRDHLAIQYYAMQT